MYEVISRWTFPGSGAGVSVMYLDEGVAPTAQAASDRVRTMWDNTKALFSNTCTVTMSDEVRSLADNDGQLLAAFSVTPGATVTGTATGQVCPDANMFLIRWGTGAVVGGRRVKGRTFVPGVPQASVTGGNVAGTIVGFWNTALAAWLATTPGLVTWHRPTPTSPTGGSIHAVTTGTVWSEVAIQRRRRG